VHIGTRPPLAAADGPQPPGDASFRARAHTARRIPLQATSVSGPKSVDLRRPPWEVTMQPSTNPPLVGAVSVQIPTAGLPSPRRWDQVSPPVPRGSDPTGPAAAPRVATDDAETRSARHHRECSADAPRASPGRNQFPTALHRRSERAKATAHFAGAPRQVIESSPFRIDARAGPADVAASRIGSLQFTLRRSYRTTSPVVRAAQAEANLSSEWWQTQANPRPPVRDAVQKGTSVQ
jgi:hypothetical protein